MSKVLQIDDFEDGFFLIPIAQCEEILQDVIDDVEEEYLPKLFGVKLSELFLADLDTNGVPQTARFEDVYDSFSYQDDNSCIHQSKGLKKLLKGIVYFLFVRDRYTHLTNEGAVSPISENSSQANNQKHDIYYRWNQSVKYWEAIQNRMCVESPDDYPEFKGLKEDYAIRY